MIGPLAHLPALERALTAAGFPALSDFWRTTFERFYQSGRRQLVLRVGRRGGKSSSLCRLAILEGLYGDHKIPPGDVGVVAFISVSRDESASRLRTIEAILRALRVSYRRVGDVIELDSRPVVFKTFAASISGVSGFTGILAICDEVAKWRDADTGANPATEVLASLRPCLATMPNAKIVLSSSPLANLDAHAAAYDLGETEHQAIAFAESWRANPSISESETHALEPDPRLHAREYSAIPASAVSAAFDADLIDRCMRPRELGPATTPALIVDPSSGRGDGMAHACAFWTLWSPPRGCKLLDIFSPTGVLLAEKAVVARDKDGNMIPDDRPRVPPCFVIDRLDVIEGAFADRLTSDDCVAMIAKKAHAAGARTWVQDQRSAFELESAVKRNRLRFVSIPWTNENKGQAVTRIRKLMIQDALVLPKDEALRRELNSFSEKILASGAIKYEGRRSGHDDRVAILITAVLAEMENHLHDSPIRKPSGMTSYGGGW